MVTGWKDVSQNDLQQSGPEKIAQCLMHCHFATVCSRITRFSPKCSEKITVYQSMQNFYQLVKYSLTNSQNWIQVMSDVTLHENMVHLTVED